MYKQYTVLKLQNALGIAKYETNSSHSFKQTKINKNAISLSPVERKITRNESLISF